MADFEDFKKEHPEIISVAEEWIFNFFDKFKDPDKKYKVNTWGKDHMAFMLLREDKGEE